jgi:ABC-2 type transport system ATP-binding protein
MDKMIIGENLSKKFGSFTAVDEISFYVGKGEIFGFLGPNGAGKTTTIRMLCGLLTSTSGSASVAGYDINKGSEDIKKVIGYMSQKFSLYRDLTVRENLEFFSGVYGVPRDKIDGRVAEMIRIAGLEGKENVLTASLAGGFKQRLALGSALVHSPRILFLDEPTAGVDPISRKSFWDFIYDLSEGGVTVVVTTHYMDEAEHCNRLAFMYDGKIIALGHPDELKTKESKLRADGAMPNLEDLFISLIERQRKEVRP